MLSLAEITQIARGRLANADVLSRDATNIRVGQAASLGQSGENDVAYFFSREYESELPQARPGVLITAEPFVAPLAAAKLPFWKTTAVLACPDPYGVMANLSEVFAKGSASSPGSTVAHLSAPAATQIHSSAVVHPQAEIGANVQIGPHCVIEAGARIGAGSYLYSGVFVGPRAQIGERCVLFSNVVVYEQVQVGHRVRIHANTTLGSDGFGYSPLSDATGVIGHRKIYHLGRVVIGDDVEIGANSCVDRGTIGDTVIGRFAKLDNQVHIGHNCTLGEGTIVCGGVLFAGGASTGKFAYIGGMAGLSNRVHVGDGAKVGAMSTITKDIPAGVTVAGNPAREFNEHFRLHARLNRWMAEKKAARGSASGGGGGGAGGRG